MINTVNTLGIDRKFLNFIKGIEEKCTANIKLNGERFNAFPLGLETRQGCLVYHLNSKL